ncbi:MAG: substrate-binding domain-containing protein [Lachnospiraceae bacterium]|nr:substrate-binding domain-containing protein [Lachnospiraceae bacterium]
MKKVIAMLLVSAMTISLVACGSSSSSSSSSSTTEETEDTEEAEAAEETEAAETTTDGDVPTIAFVPKVIGQAWWDYVQSGVEEWAETNGIDVIYQGPTSTSAEEQVQIMTDLVNQGIDVLCFSPNDPDACEEICAQAREQGIIVITTEASGMTNVDYDIEAFDEAGFGAFLMDELAAQMGEEGEYITMVGSLTMESQNNWADAAVARQQEAYPNMTLVEDERVENGSDAEKAYELTKELKSKYPDLKGILGTGSFDAPGCARAIEEMGLTGEMFAISCALPSETADYLKNGTLGSVGLWDPALSAQVMLSTAVMLYNGETIDTGSDLGYDGYDNVTVDGTVVYGDASLAITADNVDDFDF